MQSFNESGNDVRLTPHEAREMMASAEYDLKRKDLIKRTRSDLIFGSLFSLIGLPMAILASDRLENEETSCSIGNIEQATIMYTYVETITLCFTFLVCLRLLYVWLGYGKVNLEQDNIWPNEDTNGFLSLISLCIIAFRFIWYFYFISSFTKETPNCLNTNTEAYTFVLVLLIVESLRMSFVFLGIFCVVFVLLPMTIIAFFIEDEQRIENIEINE